MLFGHLSMGGIVLTQPRYIIEWTTASFDFHQMAVHKRTTILAHCNLKQITWLCSKQSNFFSFYALPSGGKLKDAVVHCIWCLSEKDWK